MVRKSNSQQGCTDLKSYKLRVEAESSGAQCLPCLCRNRVHSGLCDTLPQQTEPK